MEHRLEPVHCEQPLKALPVVDVALDRDQPVVAKFHVLQIDHHAGVTFVEQPSGEKRAEETRAAGNKDGAILYRSHGSDVVKHYRKSSHKY